MLPHAYSDLDERDTVPGILARRAAETPDRRWLTDILAGESITFGEGHDLVLRWADDFDSSLRQGSGDAVAA